MSRHIREHAPRRDDTWRTPNPTKFERDGELALRNWQAERERADWLAHQHERSPLPRRPARIDFSYGTQV
jgi:hypothetical protein